MHSSSLVTGKISFPIYKDYSTYFDASHAKNIFTIHQCLLFCFEPESAKLGSQHFHNNYLLGIYTMDDKLC